MMTENIENLLLYNNWDTMKNQALGDQAPVLLAELSGVASHAAYRARADQLEGMLPDFEKETQAARKDLRRLEKGAQAAQAAYDKAAADMRRATYYGAEGDRKKRELEELQRVKNDAAVKLKFGQNRLKKSERLFTQAQKCIEHARHVAADAPTVRGILAKLGAVDA